MFVITENIMKRPVLWNPESNYHIHSSLPCPL